MLEAFCGPLVAMAFFDSCPTKNRGPSQLPDQRK
jgi:hypothetical protein